MRKLKKSKKVKSDVNCDSCQQPMELQKSGHSKVGNPVRWRIRRFYCAICEITKTIHAGGERDKFEAMEAIEEIKSIYEEQELNNSVSRHGN